MPVYDYICSACRHRTEVIHRIDEAGPRFCPACGAEGTMRKGFSAPTVHFRGSGWAKKDRATSDGSPVPGTGSGSDAGSNDAVPAGSGTDASGATGDGGGSGSVGGSGGGERGHSKRPDRSERSKPASASSNAAGGD